MILILFGFLLLLTTVFLAILGYFTGNRIVRIMARVFTYLVGISAMAIVYFLGKYGPGLFLILIAVACTILNSRIRKKEEEESLDEILN